MPDDRILTWSDYADELPDTPGSITHHREPSYEAFMLLLYRKYHVQDDPDIPLELPTKPSPVTATVEAFVNQGRWIVRCAPCGAPMVVEPGEDYICPVCGDRWLRVVFPDDRDELEAELLRQPGERLNAPLRDWRPGQTLADLKERTDKALRSSASRPRRV